MVENIFATKMTALWFIGWVDGNLFKSFPTH